MTNDVHKQPHGKLIPVVDFSRCEAKGPCVEVRPYDVFEIRKIESTDYKNLVFLSKVKNRGLRRKGFLYAQSGSMPSMRLVH